MESPSNEKSTYDRIRQVIAEEVRDRKHASRVRMALLTGVGGLLTVRALLWDVDMASVLQPEFYRERTPHEAYLLDLHLGTGENEALELAWEKAALRAVNAPLNAASAYEEVGLLPLEVPQALGLRIHLPKGQRLRLDVAREGEDSLRLFVDIFKAPPDTLRRAARLQSGEMSVGEWSFDAPQTGDYVLRLQPELLKCGRYRVTIRVGAPWLFPVAGAGERDIGGSFLDPRDGGRREHYGIDIFAPRGTPVLAAVDGRAHMVDTTRNGGLMVWQFASGRHSAYYAHLDRLFVQRGQRIRRGDTIGLVGNTGNARTTPPHLHFGTFVRNHGPVDPVTLVLPIPPKPPPVLADLESLGWEGRTLGRGIRLLRFPSPEGAVARELSEGAYFLILAATAEWYRVVLPGGETGYVHSRHVEVPGLGHEGRSGSVEWSRYWPGSCDEGPRRRSATPVLCPAPN